MRKKFYIAPETEEIEVGTVDMLAISQIPVGGATDRFDSRKKRVSSWDNIWNE